MEAAVPITNRKGQTVAHAIVDEEDLPLVSPYRWWVDSDGYAAATSDGRKIFMHRLLLNPPNGLETDHFDGDGLNNRRANLRIVTPAQNAQNRSSDRDSTSRYRGVSWIPHFQRWRAQVTVNGRVVLQRTFTDEEAAGIAAAGARQRFMTHATD